MKSGLGEGDTGYGERSRLFEGERGFGKCRTRRRDVVYDDAMSALDDSSRSRHGAPTVSQAFVLCKFLLWQDLADTRESVGHILEKKRAARKTTYKRLAQELGLIIAADLSSCCMHRYRYQEGTSDLFCHRGFKRFFYIRRAELCRPTVFSVLQFPYEGLRGPVVVGKRSSHAKVFEHLIGELCYEYLGVARREQKTDERME